MDPINYAIADPNAALLNGIKTGLTLQQIEAQRVQQQQAQQQAAQQQADLAALYRNPNASGSDYAAVMTKYPALSENLSKAYKVLDEGQRQTKLETSARIYGALQAGRPDLAAAITKNYEEADPRGAQGWSMMTKMIETDPKLAAIMAAQSIAGLAGPDKFAETIAKLGGEQRAAEQAPADLRKKNADAGAAESDATIKAEQAKVAPQSVLLDLQKKGWDIQKIQADILSDKEKNRIAAITAAAARETNQLKREELQLKVQETREKIASETRAKVADVESARTTMDNLLNTVDRLLVNPRFNAVTGSIEGRLPALLSDDSADAIALFDTLGSQVFLSQVPAMKGMGQLSNAEGQELKAALQNLSRAQSEKQVRQNLGEIQRLTLKARKNLTTRYGVPDTVPDTPAAAAAAGPADIDALVKQYTSP